MRRRAFTLIELLVVVAIISLMISILLPALAKAKESARTVVCLSNMRQMSLGTLMYAEDNSGLVPSVGMSHGGHEVDEQGSWFRLLEPYCKTDAIYRCPSDHSKWWDETLPGGVRQRKVSFATNYYVSGKYEDPEGEYREFNRLSAIKMPARTIFAVELSEADDPALGADYWEFGAADHIHADEWLVNPDPEKGEPPKQVALARHSGRSNYTFLDGRADTLAFHETFEIGTGSTPGKIVWSANKYDPKVAQ